jgi:hypothetical protein
LSEALAIPCEKNEAVAGKASAYLAQHGRFTTTAVSVA